VAGTFLILLATWLNFLREHASPPAVEHHESSAAESLPVLSLSRYRLNPFASGIAEDSSAGFADEVCRLRKAQGLAGPGMAVVVGRHDPRPLTPAARKRFGSNLGLAQKRAETVARLLLDPAACPGAQPMDAIAIAVPNGRTVPAGPAGSVFDEERRPDVFGLRIVLEKDEAGRSSR